MELKSKIVKRASSKKILERINHYAAGIDISPKENWVCVPPEATEVNVRKFGSTTPQIRKIVSWLKECGVKTVAMESTGVYWIPLRENLEKAGFEVVLVHAQYVKAVPGRKTDVLDCQWIQELHTYGLLRGAYRPPDKLLALRTYTRERTLLVREASRKLLKMQKALDQMNVLVHRAVSDISGKTGMCIIRSIVAGVRDPAMLARHRDKFCKRTQEEIAEALDGNFLEYHVDCLQLALQSYDFIQNQISALEAKIEAELLKFDPNIDVKDKPIPEPRCRAKKNKGDPCFDVRRIVYPLFGTDLTQIEAISNRTLMTIISEIGWDMGYWPTVKHFTSWLSLCPGSNKSGGVSHSGKTRPSANRLATAFRLAANALHKSQGPLGHYLRRMKFRIGKAEAITATAHKIARIVYTLLKTGAAYDPEKMRDLNGEQKRKQLKRLHKVAAEQGFYLVSEAQMLRYNQLSGVVS